ncbi:hypothetical protein HYT24_02310 [Candidatus Pacearchaeota archaeon]|nr:hypothetical protein [Candidatus Pacearchaeota archaeon]
MEQDLKNSVMKTGTTILGIVCKDGVVMASDRRVTIGGSVVVSKHMQKTLKVGDYFLYSGAGSAFVMKKTKMVLEAELRLKELKSRSRPTVKEAANLLSVLVNSQAGHIGAMLGGINEDGSTELYTVDPAGHVEKVLDYDANLGSGFAFVLGLLERQYKPNTHVEEGVKLAVEALKSSTQRDTASGNGFDVFTITRDGIKQVISQEIRPDYESE